MYYGVHVILARPMLHVAVLGSVQHGGFGHAVFNPEYPFGVCNSLKRALSSNLLVLGSM